MSFAAPLILLALLSLPQDPRMAAQEEAASCRLPATSEWVNELGSTMSLSISASGVVQGRYATAVGCGPGIQRPLVGFCNGYAVTFTVNWQECASLTSWTGTFNSSDNSIKTLWYLALASPPAWNSISAGSDIFKKK